MGLEKFAKTTLGSVAIATGYSLKLAKWGLNASDVVLNGAVNMANSFVNAPKLGIGQALLNGVQKETGKLAQWFIKNGKKLTH